MWNARDEVRRRRSVLVVEDDDDARQALVDVLEQAGYEATPSASAEEAFAHLTKASAPPDVVLLDLHLPGMDGWEFRVKQQLQPALASVPVVVMTADNSSAARAIHSQGFVPKPIDRDTLLLALSSAIETSERERGAALDVQARGMSSLASLASGVAHEVNNPLTCVLANLKRLRQRLGDVAPEDRRLLDDAIEGAEQIKSVVRDLASFARPDRQTRKVLDVHRIVDAAIAITAGEIATRAKLERVYEETAPVFANESRLGQVFLNLLLNAVQAIPAGDPERHRIVVRVASADAEHVLVEISDTGTGIPAAILPRVFEPFFSTKPEHAGSGLGLWISYQIVRDHEGSIEVVSEPGSGTTVKVTLPSADAQLRARIGAR